MHGLGSVVPTGPYWSYLLRLTRSCGVLLLDLYTLTHKTLTDHWVSLLLASVQSLPSLSLLSISPFWWCPSRFLEKAFWSRILVKFHMMNARLGNRDAYRGGIL